MFLIQGFIYFTILLSVKIVMSVKTGFCNPHEIKLQTETNCTNCHINVFVDCPMGTKKLTTMKGNAGCEYTQHLGPGHNITKDGCTHTCEQTMQVYNCCTGYWGPQCDECPGGNESPCSGHGICNDTLIGTGLCTCDAGWSGYSCEFCVDPDVGGVHCNEHTFEPTYDLCGNVTCPNNSRCISIDNEVICICTWPYVEHDEDSDKNTTEIVCKELDTCTVPPLCHQNATCQKSSVAHISGIDKNCSCNHGYTGDGYQCDAIDPCQTDNGGCDEVTSSCVYIDAGKSKCECRHGFENNVLTDECSLIDVCSSSNSTCDPKASCLTVGPYQTTCQCPDGYAGDGHNCYGNIVQKIKDLNEFDPDLNGTLKFIQQAIEKYYYTELTEHGPFTMFVPVDDGFRNIDNPDFQEWLNDEVRIRQILRQHIVVGEFMASNLTDVTFYTLQGSAAVLKVNWKDEYRFRIHGANRKGKTMRRDIIATNGIIHIISKLMINDADIQVFHKANVYQSLMLDRYSTFKQFVDSCGTEISDILQNDNVTLFAPSNPHFNELPTELMDHLKSLKAGEELKELLMNHIFPGRIEITDLINEQTITSLLNMTNSISVSSTGQVLLNGRVEITQADMPATNGLMHDIHGLLITSTMNVYPSRCDNDTNGQGQGCCAGFYGPDCSLCPGGFTNPCHGHGTCDDGISGSGNCTCQEPFTGWNCKSCTHNHWGEDCLGTCDCVRGECVEAYYKGYGECRCDAGVHGTNCDRQDTFCQDTVSNPWSFLGFITCHIHAQCIVFSDDTYRKIHLCLFCN